MIVGGKTAELRFIWDATDPAEIKRTNEVSVSGEPWQLVEVTA
jgi:hypothetical protein